jgi:hypothetical protein
MGARKRWGTMVLLLVTLSAVCDAAFFKNVDALKSMPQMFSNYYSMASSKAKELAIPMQKITSSVTKMLSNDAVRAGIVDNEGKFAQNKLFAKAGKFLRNNAVKVSELVRESIDKVQGIRTAEEEHLLLKRNVVVPPCMEPPACSEALCELLEEGSICVPKKCESNQNEENCKQKWYEAMKLPCQWDEHNSVCAPNNDFSWNCIDRKTSAQCALDVGDITNNTILEGFSSGAVEYNCAWDGTSCA